MLIDLTQHRRTGPERPGADDWRGPPVEIVEEAALRAAVDALRRRIRQDLEPAPPAS